MPPSGIRLDLATIISTSVEGVLYGISLIMFGGTIWALTHGRPKCEFNWPMALVALLLTILSTTHFTVDIQRLKEGFINYSDTFPGGTNGFFADVTQRTFVMKIIVYVLQTLLGDAVMIYRCFVVWQDSMVIALPIVLWCATSVTSTVFVYNLSHATHHPEDIFQFEIGKWAVSFYVLTITTNVVTSALSVYRISSMNRRIPGVVRVFTGSGVEPMFLLRVLVDSAVLYTLTLVAVLVCYLYKNTGEFVVLDMTTPIIAITFYMVLVRIAVERNRSAGDATDLLSPLRFASVVTPSPIERTFTIPRRSSV